MKIAVTYENGNVFQHFGKTESFKVYEIEDGSIIKAEVIGTAGAGHEALAGFLKGKGVDTVICGGLGAGAKAALAEAGIEVVSGAEGNTDDVVEEYLAGNVESKDVTCDHHAHSEEEEENCTHDCGTCPGHCGGPLPIKYEGKNAGKTVRVHYRGTFNDGTEFDSSFNRGEPMEFTSGVGMMIPGFDKAVVAMEVGEEVDIHLMPEEAYGMPDPNAIFKVNVAQVPGSEALSVGQQVYLSDGMGRPFPVIVTEREGDFITFDANSEMAGKELNFHIQLVEVKE